MANRPDLLDKINRLRDHLNLLALAARSLDDADTSNAMHLGISEASMVADEIKAMLVNDSTTSIASGGEP